MQSTKSIHVGPISARGPILALVTGFAASLMASFALAQGPCAAALDGETQIHEIPTEQTRPSPARALEPDLDILAQIIRNHASVRQLTPTHTHQAFQNLMLVLDPDFIFFTEEDIHNIAAMSSSEIARAHKQTLYSPDKDEVMKLLRLATSRHSQITTLLFQNLEFQEAVKLEAQRLLAQQDSDPSHLGRARNAADLPNNWMHRLASNLAGLIDANPNAQLTLDQAFERLAQIVKEDLYQVAFRLSPANLIVMLVKAYVQALDPHSDLFLPTDTRNFSNRYFASDASTGTSKEQVVDVQLEPAPGGMIARITLNGFYKGASRQVRDQISELKQKHNLTGLILDLRDNRGGITSEMVDLLGAFVPRGPAIQFIRDDEDRIIHKIAPDQVIWTGPLLLHVDGSSASASESLAGALQDYKRALIVGAPQTHGKGTSQEVAPLTGNLFLKLTSRIFTSPSGRSPQIQGVVPGIIIEDQPELTIPLEKDSLSPLQPMTAPNAIEPQDRLENEISPELTRTLGERSRARQQSWAFESPNGPAQRTQDRRGLNERKFVQNTEESLQIMRDWLDLISGH